MFDFLKRKELEEIAKLRNELEVANDRISSLSRFQSFADIESEKVRLEALIAELNSNLESETARVQALISSLKEDRELLDMEIAEKKAQLVELDERILLQDFGLYSPVFDFATSDEYRDKLDTVRGKQKQMILDKRAATASTTWTVNGSKAQGEAMTNQNIKQIIRCFNDECDVLVSKVKFNNINAFIEKMEKSFAALNRMNTKNAVSISQMYLDLKKQELQLAYEYAVKKQEEKEEERRQRELLREEARLQKELEEARKDIEKEQKHYNNALLKLNKQIEECSDTERDELLEKRTEIEQRLSELDSAIQNIDYREANKRAGYVYIISNIGSFGENVYKIGMTRRLDPLDRINELGDASVPFKFDIHAMIFSEDAPKLETALHHAFDNKRVNMTNIRREFFNVTLEEIESVIKANYDKTVEFTKTPEAEQYRESLKIRGTTE